MRTQGMRARQVDEFDGDWQLAVAAYNSGEGNVHRAIRRNRKAGKPTDFWHLRLPRETVAYVPKLLALVDIVSRPDEYGLELPQLEDRPYFDVVELGGQMDLALIAELAGIDMDELYALNPGFNRWATDPDGPHVLSLPIDKAEPFRQALAKVDDKHRIRWQRHRIRQGETLGHIVARLEFAERLREVGRADLAEPDAAVGLHRDRVGAETRGTRVSQDGGRVVSL